MEATARIGWFVNDLHRHPVPYYAFSALARAARWHKFVRHDGPVSIGRAFVAADWRRLLATAGIEDGAAKIAWRMPFRSEEHTSELQSLMRTSYAGFCLK